MANPHQYNVNFFRPRSDHARANMKLIITLALIWFIGVFGFQCLLVVLNTPTPEKTHAEFQSVWPQIEKNMAPSNEVKVTFSKVVLSVLGKNIAVKDHHKTALKEALSWTVHTMLPEESAYLMEKDPDEVTIGKVTEVLGLSDQGFDKIMANLLPTSLVKVTSPQLSADTKKRLPEIMDLYLVHNRNALTDFTFLGFPFHYWYTAQFLLIMFVLLCLTYAVLTDRNNKTYSFVEEN
jgi:putative solute:sodium symporter small subunit